MLHLPTERVGLESYKNMMMEEAEKKILQHNAWNETE